MFMSGFLIPLLINHNISIIKLYVQVSFVKNIIFKISTKK